MKRDRLQAELSTNHGDNNNYEKNEKILKKTHPEITCSLIGIRYTVSATRIVLMDFQLEKDREESLYVGLRRKFQMQQLGKIKWLENREKQLNIHLDCIHFFPIEFMNDRLFVLDYLKKYGGGLYFASDALKKTNHFYYKHFNIAAMCYIM